MAYLVATLVLIGVACLAVVVSSVRANSDRQYLRRRGVELDPGEDAAVEIREGETGAVADREVGVNGYHFHLFI